jgi:prophage DNA circulation protein
MAWQELVRTQASFRGVPFEVDTSERSGGRRGVTHEYPFRDEPYREDTGRKVRNFTIEGHVIGPEYLAAKNRLIGALESPSGPGELVHPYYGTRHVAVGDFRVREAATEGGLARFSIDFEETPGSPSQPAAVADRAAELQTRTSAARSAVGAEFTASYAPGIHTGALVTAVIGVATAVDAALQSVGQGVQESAASAARAAEVAASAAGIIESGVDVLAALVDLFNAATGVSSAALLTVYTADVGTRPAEVTSNRTAEAGNYDAIQQLSRRLTVVRAAELALEETFSDYASAVAARDAIADLLDEQTELAGDDAYPALVELRSALVLAVPGETSALPQLVTFTPTESVPSLVLAWKLYRNVTGEADILARNTVKNPMFLVGGTELEVLSDAP